MRLQPLEGWGVAKGAAQRVVLSVQGRTGNAASAPFDGQELFVGRGEVVGGQGDIGGA